MKSNQVLMKIYLRKKMTGGNNLTQGGVYLAKLNPKKGNEVGKVRPVVVLTNQYLLNNNPPVTFICPLSSYSSPEFASLHIELPPRDRLKKTSYALVEHCKAIDSSRLTNNRLTQLSQYELKQIIKSLRLLIDAI